ncbi:Carboxypeptidase regulatory-like domain protein [uncultured archaeon]|nr:Carboxypeptidase regulatory-like domain protein [uncultured archaeon]
MSFLIISEFLGEIIVKLNSVLSILLAFVCLAASAAGQSSIGYAHDQNGSLNVMAISDANGLPVSGAFVSVARHFNSMLVPVAYDYTAYGRSHFSLAAGIYDVNVSKQGLKSAFFNDVNVVSGSDTNIVARLADSNDLLADRNFGTLIVWANDMNANKRLSVTVTVYVGAGQVVGFSSPDGTIPATFRLSPGAYKMKVEKGGFSTYSAMISISAGRDTNVEVLLAPAAGDNCSDSDVTAQYPDGRNIFAKGSVTGTRALYNPYTDYCQGNSVAEYYCHLTSIGDVSLDIIPCPNGCVDGACNAAPVVVPADQNGTLNVLVKYDSNSAQISGARVRLSWFDGNVLRLAYMFSNNFGLASMNLGPGQYDLNVSKQGFIGSLLSDVNVASARDTNVTVSLKPVQVQNGSLRVFVVDWSSSAPIPNARVSVKNPQGALLFSKTTDANGTAVFDGILPPAAYNVEVVYQNYEPSAGMILVQPGLWSALGFSMKPNVLPIKLSLVADLNSANENRAGTWGIFRPGIGNANKIPNDWHWKAILTLDKARAIKSITMKHNVYGEGWSTAWNTMAYGKYLYPLVVLKDLNQLNTAYGQSFGPYSNGTLVLDLYGQVETGRFYGGTLTVAFTDGNSVSAKVPVSRTVPISKQQ